jgi:hypothetical protein
VAGLSLFEEGAQSLIPPGQKFARNCYSCPDAKGAAGRTRGDHAALNLPDTTSRGLKDEQFFLNRGAGR